MYIRGKKSIKLHVYLCCTKNITDVTLKYFFYEIVYTRIKVRKCQVFKQYIRKVTFTLLMFTVRCWIPINHVHNDVVY